MRTLLSLIGLLVQHVFTGTPSSESPDGPSTDTVWQIDPWG